MITFLTVLCVLLAIVIVAIVLLQQGKGSDLGSAFGGGSSNSMFGALGPSGFFRKANIHNRCNMANLIFLVSLLIKK